MKKTLLFLLTVLMVAISANASIAVCGIDPATCRVSYRDADYPFYFDEVRGLRLAL